MCENNNDIVVCALIALTGTVKGFDMFKMNKGVLMLEKMSKRSMYLYDFAFLFCCSVD